MYSIVIGGGVAGLSAALYLGRANRSAIILESNFWGGQTALLNKVDNYPAVKNATGFDISNALYEQVKELNIEMKNEMVTSVKQLNDLYQVTTNKNKYLAKNIIIATGAKVAQLGLKEEQLFKGRGVSYCATCDGNFFKNKSVAVYGNGKTALEDVKYLINLCKKVYWIIPNKNISNEILNQVKDFNNLVINYSSEVSRLEGDDTLKEVVIYNKQKAKTEKLNVEGLFVTLGRRPDLSWLEVEIKTNKNGYIIVDKNCQTSKKGIFACGDITSRNLKQIVTACSDGAIAASYIISKE